MTLRLAMLVALLAIVEGCSALTSQADTTKYFVLTPIAIVQRNPSGSFDRSVGIGPVTIPDHLEDYLVTRLADEEIDISDTERWGEPLHDALGGVLRQNLIALLGTQRVLAYPWDRAATPDLAVALEILQFERTANETVDLRARWSVERGSDRAPLLHEETSVSKPIRGADTRAAVTAFSAALGDLSQQIAVAVRRVPLGNASR